MMVIQSSKVVGADQAPSVLSSEKHLTDVHSLQKTSQSLLIKEAIEELIDGILIVTEQRQLVYANDNARRVIEQLYKDEENSDLVPKEIWHICQSLIQSRNLFPDQQWLIESDISTATSIALHVRAKWLQMEDRGYRYLLLMLEDRHQAIQNIAIEEAQKYKLTPREKEVWLLHRANYTYKQIALSLCITPNTVKKHMGSIYIKQKEILAIENQVS